MEVKNIVKVGKIDKWQKTITLAHGNGGAENNGAYKRGFYEAFKNEILEKVKMQQL